MADALRKFGINRASVAGYLPLTANAPAMIVPLAEKADQVAKIAFSRRFAGFNVDMTRDEVLDATRGVWPCGQNFATAGMLMVPTAYGIVVDVFRITSGPRPDGDRFFWDADFVEPADADYGSFIGHFVEPGRRRPWKWPQNGFVPPLGARRPYASQASGNLIQPSSYVPTYPEKQLVSEFCRSRGQIGVNWTVNTKVHHGLADLVDLSSGRLIEAKASADRDSMRQALGQVLDYGRDPRIRTTYVLAPMRPENDLEDLLLRNGVGIIFRVKPGEFDQVDP